MSGNVNDYENISLSGNLDSDIALFKSIFSHDAVLRTREIFIGGAVRCFIIFMDGMLNSAQQGETVVEALVEAEIQQSGISCDFIAKNILFANEVTKLEVNAKTILNNKISLLYFPSLCYF